MVLDLDTKLQHGQDHVATSIGDETALDLVSGTVNEGMLVSALDGSGLEEAHALVHSYVLDVDGRLLASWGG